MAPSKSGEDEAGTAEDSALGRLLEREIRKLESGLALRRAAERRGLARDGAVPLVLDPAWPELDGLLPAPSGTAPEWMAERLGFLRGALSAWSHANAVERAYLWLGAACGFVGAVPMSSAALGRVLERAGAAEEHFRELALWTDGDDDESRRHLEPWDGSGGLVPPRELRGERLLGEARELWEEQRAALEILEERAGE
ncbi:MAG: hypothetical protein IPN34_01930 [Planctomycetes bacterium]|nr:hypothetical protein [Planctomycetota bacterium]